MEKFDTLHALTQYHTDDEIELNAVQEAIKFINENGLNSFNRTNTNGHVTGSAFVIDVNGNILLNHHKKANIWIQFGGHSDGESDTKKVALREVMEETGLANLKIIDDIFYCAIYNVPAGRTKDEPAHKHYDINFLVISNTKDFVISSESTELRWCTPKQALALVNGDYACTKMILKSQQLLQKYKCIK